jgi:integrase
MGRPQGHIRIHDLPDGSLALLPKGSKQGREIHGLSFHKPSGEFYSIAVGGARRYWGRDLAAAIRDYLRSKGAADSSASISGAGAIPDEIAPTLNDEQLAALGSKKLVITLPADFIESHLDNPGIRALYNRQRAAQGLPPISAPDALAKSAAQVETERQQDKGVHRLRDALKLWRKMKEDEDVTEQQIARTEKIVNRLIECIGNRPVSELDAQDFANWRRWVTRFTRNLSGGVHNEHHARLKSFFIEVKRDKPSWNWPIGLREWLEDWKPQAHAVDGSHRKRIPVDAFKRLLAVCETWKSVAPDSIGKETQRDRALRRLAKAKRLEGYRFAAIVRLAANACLDNVDCMRIRWDNLKLDCDLPHMDFARPKPAKKTGAPVPRRTPLLPATVAALRELRELTPDESFVMVGAHGEEYKRTTFSNAVDRLLTEAQVDGWSWKHLRNIAGSLGRKNKIQTEVIDTLLGHAVKGVSSRYTDETEVDAAYLVPMVNLIGAEYFDGETVDA